MPLQIIQYFWPQCFGQEMIYSFVIILTSLMIYFGTKELYDLSQYKGLKYFRLAFLFFAIAYFFRSFIKFVLVYLEIPEIARITPIFFGAVTLFAFMYFSLMAIFYLLYSVMWKKWNHESKTIPIFHALAIILSGACVIFHTTIFHLGINLLILALAFTTVIAAHQNKKKPTYMYITYILLAIFWTLNIIDILTPRFLQNTQIAIYLISISIFLAILYKVLKKAGSN